VRVARDRSGIDAATFALGDCGGPHGADATLEPDVIDRLARIFDKASMAFEYRPFFANLGHGAGQNELAGLPGPRRGSPAATPPTTVLGMTDTESNQEPQHLVVLNPDTYVVPDALFALLESLGDPDVGIAEARQIPLEHPKRFDLVTGETPWASGCAMALPFRTFSAVGGFDPGFFLHGDDVDLSWRVRMTGLVVRHVVGAAVFHDKRPTGDGFPEPTPEEERQGMLARLLLAHRAERPDVILEWLSWTDSHGTTRHRDGAAEFRRRREEGELPLPYRQALGVDPGTVSDVATFHGSEYAEHRF
jgi:GT2 family glycosyltransferase